MGTFRVTVGIGGPEGPDFERLDALVDTGATYTFVPRDVLERLGIRPDEERLLVLADGREVAYPVAWIRVRIDGRTQPTIAVFGDAGTETLLGAFTLEGFGVAADPVNRRLVPVRALLKTFAGGAWPLLIRSRTTCPGRPR
jgi:clan AA aspartic protease